MVSRNMMSASLKACKIKVLSNGFVTLGDGVVGVLTGREFKPVLGEPIPLEKVESVSVIGNRELLRLNLVGGKHMDFHPQNLTPLEASMLATQSLVMPKNLRQVRDALEMVCPSLDEWLLRDELKEKDFASARIIGSESDEILEVTDDVLKKFHEHFIDLLYENGYYSKTDAVPSNALMDEALMNKLYDNSRNTFREWLESLEWDGVPRMRRWFIETAGASAPPLRTLGEGAEDKYLEDVSSVWFMGAVARNMSPSPVTQDIVPVLISSQGLGKGAFVRYTSYCKNDWYRSTSESMKDAKRFLEQIRGGVIVELEEGAQLMKDDAETIKGFISRSTDQIRKPYAAREQACPRHFIFIMSSNRNTLFTDDTGNRRFFPMYLDETRQTRPITVDPDDAIAHYAVEQVWAEARVMYERGHPCTLSDRTTLKYAAVMQDYCYADDVDVDRIDDYLNDPLNGYSQPGSRVDYRVILEEVFGLPYGRGNIPAEIKDIIGRWGSKTQEWVKIPRSIRVGSRVTKGWERRYVQNIDAPVRRLDIRTGRRDLDGFDYRADGGRDV